MSSSRESILEAWAPPGCPWSPWTKPVLFAHLTESLVERHIDVAPFDTSWAPHPRERTALVLDLPRENGVHAGVSLSKLGYQPVPLYNALPPPDEALTASVDVIPIMEALVNGAASLASLVDPANAPPAFLLDRQRAGVSRWVASRFDNRSRCFASDFPSATFLLEHDIRRVLLVQPRELRPQHDLAEVLIGWQKGGVAIDAVRLDQADAIRSCPLPRSAVWAMIRRWLDALDLMRNRSGEFGHIRAAG